jgi:hypothetical protein
MANWKHTLKISKEWQAAANDEMDLAELARALARKLTFVSVGNGIKDETVQWIIEQFTDFANDGCTDPDALDGIMEQLYDWGDTELDNDWPRTRLCRIDAMSAA